MRLRPFAIAVEEEALRDLERRLAATRWPAALPETGWSLGTDPDYLQQLVAYWRREFDWPARVAALNRLPQFVATIDGHDIHFVWQRGRGPAPTPVVLTHGWPGSFAEFERLVPLLTDPEAQGGDPADAFDVVVPSLPGYGFSPPPRRLGMDVFRIAGLWAALMRGLGYERFVAQGGDFGAGVATALGLEHPDRLLGVHLNYVPGSYRPPVAEAKLDAEERAFLEAADRWYREEGAYAHLQATRPQTLAVGLNDSPAGLAAWMVEKFRGWSDCEGEVERRFTKDDLLTQVGLYWFTGAMPAAIRLYHEMARRPLRLRPGEAVGVPCAIARFPREAPFPPRRYIERGYRVTRWTEMPAGGHFAAMEEPELLAGDLRAFARELRAARGTPGAAG